MLDKRLNCFYSIRKDIIKLNLTKLTLKHRFEDFLGGAVVKNPPANAGDTGSNPGPGRSHMPWSN